MKKFLISLLAAALAVTAAHAQRSVPPKTSFRDYRPDGEYRLWTFMKNDSTIGRLNSIAVGGTMIDGAEAFRVRAELDLDYRKAEGSLIINVMGENYFFANGTFAGCDLTRTINEQEGKVSLRRDGAKLAGSVVRNGNRSDVELACARGSFAIDYDLPGQYELYFAMHGLRVGDVIDDSVIVPTDLGVTYLKGKVTGWTWQQLWRGVYDSVFVVVMTSPVPQELFINRDLWLRKINIPDQRIRIYLDAVRAPAKKPETAGSTAQERPAAPAVEPSAEQSLAQLTMPPPPAEKEPVSDSPRSTGSGVGGLVADYFVYLVVGLIGIGLLSAVYIARRRRTQR